MSLNSHHLQERPDSCVAACVRMLQLLRGPASSEADIRAQLGEPPVTLALAGRTGLGTYRAFELDAPVSIEILGGLARSHGGCAVTVTGGPATAWAEAAGLTSPHGVLATKAPHIARLEMQGRPHHTIVLLEVTQGRVRYLDPFFHPAGQPAEADLVSFVQWGWIGDALFLETT